MPRAFLVKKKKQRVESIIEELAKQEGLETRVVSSSSSSDGENDRKNDEDTRKISPIITDVFSLAGKRENARKVDDGETRLRTLEDLIEKRLRETLNDTSRKPYVRVLPNQESNDTRGKQQAFVVKSQGIESSSFGKDKQEILPARMEPEKGTTGESKTRQVFRVNGEVQAESDWIDKGFGKVKSKPPPLLRASPRSAFEKVVAPKFQNTTPATLTPPPPLEPRNFHSGFYYRSELSPTRPLPHPYELKSSQPVALITAERNPYHEPEEALNLSRRPSRSSDSEEGSRDEDISARNQEYMTKKRYILERNGRPEAIPSIELMNGAASQSHRSPILANSTRNVSPIFSPSSNNLFSYSSIFADRIGPENYMYPKHPGSIERNGFGPFDLRRENFIRREAYPAQDVPLNLHQSPEHREPSALDLRDGARHEKRLDYASDINSNNLNVPSQYNTAPPEDDVKVTVTCDEPGKLHPSKIKLNDVTLEEVIRIQNTVSTKRPGKTVARAPILGVEYIQNGTDMKLRDMMDKEEPKSPSSSRLDSVSDSGEAMDVVDEKECNSEGSLDMAESEDGGEEGLVMNGMMMESKSDDGKPSPNRKYVCDICGKGFSRSNTLVTHKRIHTGDKPFKCEVCGRAFRQPGNLTRHRLTHTTVKPYVCSQCGKAFNRASNLHTHMRTHTNYKPFICQYCGKGFHQKIDMKIHSYTHTGEKPHKCKKCGRGFKQLTHLTYHMRTHSEVKMYTCAYCGKGFNQKGNLQAHIYGHTGERPYKCEICGKGFTLASTLNTHRRTHADKKPFVCKYCGKDFYQKNALKSHLMASHPYTGESLL